MESCIFCKIRDRIIPKEFIFEDKDVMVFPDINPVKPIHLLIVSKKHIEDLLMIDDERLMIELINISKKMLKKFKLEDKGYRLVVNGGGAQVIDHLHIHLMGPMAKGAKM